MPRNTERATCPDCGKTYTVQGLGTHRRNAHGHKATNGHYGRPGQRLPDDVKARIIELAQQPGSSRNGIADQLGVSRASVTGVCRRAGVPFDRTATKAATEAHQADLAARRAEIQAILLEDAMRLRGQMWEPHEYIDHGGKDFDEARWMQDEPTPADKHKLMQAASAALGRSLDLAKHDADIGDKPAVDVWLDAMTGGH